MGKNDDYKDNLLIGSFLELFLGENMAKICPKQGKNTVVLAVSCGVDSSCMLDVALKLKNELNLGIVIAHVNHGKRLQSDMEEQYIRDFVKERPNLVDGLEILKLNHDDFSGSNFQEEARIKRLEFFEKVLNKYNSNILVLAHHLDDDIETIIMRLMRSSSVDSCYGMNKIANYKDKYYILRPFLDITKAEIYKYAQENMVKYFEDASNQENDYTRNKIRHNILDEKLEKSITLYKKEISEAIKLINEKRDFLINKIFDIKNCDILFNINEFKAIDYQMKVNCLFEILKKYQYSEANIEEIIKIIESDKQNFKNKYKHILIIKEYNDVIIRLSEGFDNDFEEIIIDKEGIYNLDYDYFLEVKNTNLKNNNHISNIDLICYNQSMLPFKIRRRQDGDRIAIKNGSKKIKDMLIDLKIKKTDRDKALLLLDKDDNVLAILGIKKSYLLNECDKYDLIIERKKK